MIKKDDEILTYYRYFLKSLFDLACKVPGNQETTGTHRLYYSFDEICENFLSSGRNILQWPELRNSQ